MQKFFSIYLDLVRFLAAMGVFIGHMMNHSISGHVIWWRLGNYGQFCVTIFFVLSGYVIAYVTSERENSGKTYFISRFSRLYSVTLLSLVLTYILDCYGQEINPDLYNVNNINPILIKPVSLTGYLSTLFFVNEFQVFGFGGIVPGSNTPFWSLSFEFTYYLVAGLFLFFPKILSVPFLLFVLLMAGSTTIALLPVWCFGFFLYKTSACYSDKNDDKAIISTILPLALFILSSSLLIAFPYILEEDVLPKVNFGFDFPWGAKPWHKTNILVDYIVALTFGLNIITARQLKLIFYSLLIYMEKPIRWLGSMTFPLYCIHYPAIGFFKSVSQWGTETLLNSIFIGASTLLLVVVVTPVCDWLKNFIRNCLASVI